MRRTWVVAVLLLVGACTGPVRSSAVYESKAGRTAAVVVSAAQTALQAVAAAEQDKAHGRYLTQMLVKLLASWLYHDSRYVDWDQITSIEPDG
jgi:hypothetical protein